MWNRSPFSSSEYMMEIWYKGSKHKVRDMHLKHASEKHSMHGGGVYVQWLIVERW